MSFSSSNTYRGGIVVLLHVQRWYICPFTHSEVVYLSSAFTFIFALVRKNQAAVLTFCVMLIEPFFDFSEAEVLFEERVSVDS